MSGSHGGGVTARIPIVTCAFHSFPKRVLHGQRIWPNSQCTGKPCVLVEASARSGFGGRNFASSRRSALVHPAMSRAMTCSPITSGSRELIPTADIRELPLLADCGPSRTSGIGQKRTLLNDRKQVVIARLFRSVLVARYGLRTIQTNPAPITLFPVSLFV